LCTNYVELVLKSSIEKRVGCTPSRVEKSKTKQPIVDLVEQEWFRWYPRTARVIFDQGGEVDNHVFHGLCIKWCIHPVPITATSKNPRANAIVERMHRVLGDMLFSW